MSATNVDPTEDSQLEPRIEIEERKQHTIENYPSNIAEQLKKAAFDQISADTFIKYQEPVNTSKKPQVAKVEITSDHLTISAGDIVGVVNLTPSSKLQINPKIGWEEIVEMFLTVQERDRSLSYNGIPIREFLADDVSIEDIFVIVAVNYMNSVEPLFRRGLVRDFDSNHVDAFDARGRIDIEQSMRNRISSGGIPKQHFIQKNVNYNVPVNNLIYIAGMELYRLFQFHADPDSHPGYYTIFSRLTATIDRLKARDVTAENISSVDASRISLSDLPRQRHYYDQAIKISKTILSSSIGEPLDDGQEDLTVDYILSMEHLFERFTNITLQKQIEKIKLSQPDEGTSRATISKESHVLFEETDRYTQQPDHVIRFSGDVVAVADSKYYAGDHSPIKDASARSRLFSYAYQLHSDQLAFICPQNFGADSDSSERVYSLADREGMLSVVAPNRFSIDGFDQSVRQFLLRIFDIDVSELSPQTTNSSKIYVCLPGIEIESIEEATLIDQLNYKNVRDNFTSVIKYTSKELSQQTDWRANFNTTINQTRKFNEYMRKNLPGSYDFAVPVFIPANGSYVVPDDSSEDNIEAAEEERIVVHYIATDDDNQIRSEYLPEPMILSW